MSSLKTKTLNGMGWSMVDNVIGTGTSFVIGIILANILPPEEFGIIGIIMVFLAIALIFIDSGFSQSLIRKKDINKDDYSTLFWFSIFVAIVCYVLIFFTSSYVSEFFGQPILKSVLPVTALMLIFNALGSVQRVILTREINFKTQAYSTLIAAISSGVVGVTMAVLGFGVWSLVGQILSRYLFQSIVLWILCKWKPTMTINKSSFKEMFHFGYKLLLSGLLDTLYRNVFYVIIGKFYSPKSLGEYTRAGQFASIFSSNLLTVIQKVSYPVLSSIQDEPERLKEGYRKLIKTSMLLTFALMLGMAAVANPLILTLIGPKWLPAVYYLQILCFSEMLYPLHAINLTILNVLGRSDLFLKLEIIKKTLAIPMILVGVYVSIEAMLWSGVAFSIISYFINAYYSAKLINYPVFEQIRDILPTFFVSLFVASAMWSLTLLDFNVHITLIIQVILGILLAMSIYNKLNLEEYREVLQIIQTLTKKIGRKK